MGGVLAELAVLAEVAELRLGASDDWTLKTWPLTTYELSRSTYHDSESYS